MLSPHYSEHYSEQFGFSVNDHSSNLFFNTAVLGPGFIPS
jgi:hypothetical protein